MGEKKVWLDRLSEKKIQKIGFEKGFKYFYEAKTIKLLLEGILLEKVQDMVEKELYSRGEFLGWKIMDVRKMEEDKKEEDFEFNKGLLKLPSKEAYTQERDYKEKMEDESFEYEENKIIECKYIGDEIDLGDKN